MARRIVQKVMPQRINGKLGKLIDRGTELYNEIEILTTEFEALKARIKDEFKPEKGKYTTAIGSVLKVSLSNVYSGIPLTVAEDLLIQYETGGNIDDVATVSISKLKEYVPALEVDKKRSVIGSITKLSFKE